MSERPWYKRYPSDFIAGAITLNVEQKGAYSVLLDLMYDRQAPIADDPVDLARICGCSTRKFRVLRDELAAAGKIILREGLISNARFEREKSAENHAKTARKSAEKRPAINENKDLNSSYQIPETRDQKPNDKLDSGGVVDAVAIADEVAVIAGHDPERLPLKWMSAGPVVRVQAWLRNGWSRDTVLNAARASMERKRDGPPFSINFFEEPIARAHARLMAPPIRVVSITPREVAHENHRRSDGRRTVQDVARGLVDEAERRHRAASGGD